MIRSPVVVIQQSVDKQKCLRRRKNAGLGPPADWEWNSLDRCSNSKCNIILNTMEHKARRISSLLFDSSHNSSTVRLSKRSQRYLRSQNVQSCTLHKRIKQKNRFRKIGVEKSESSPHVGKLSELLKKSFSAGEGNLLFYKKRIKSPIRNVACTITSESNDSTKSLYFQPSTMLFSSPTVSSRPGDVSTKSQSSHSERTLTEALTTDSEETVLEIVKTPDAPSCLLETLTQKISLQQVRSLPPWEQAKLPRSAFLAAQLDAIPDVNYSLKYGFEPFHRSQWVPPRCIASSFMTTPNMPYPYEIPSYLVDIAQPIRDLRLLARPWWAQDGHTSVSRKDAKEERCKDSKRISWKYEKEQVSDSDSCYNTSFADRTSNIHEVCSSRSVETYERSVFSLSQSSNTVGHCLDID